MKRRLFLRLAPLAPLAAAVPVTQPAANMMMELPAVEPLSPDREAELLRLVRLLSDDTPGFTALWPSVWRSVVEATADRPQCFSGETPVGKPIPIPAVVYEDGDRDITVWVDGRFREIFRVNRQTVDSTDPTSGRSCEAGEGAPDATSTDQSPQP